MLLAINKLYEDILEQVASNKSSVLEKNILQNKQILQLFTMVI
jgi:hypothetical protein